MSSRKFTDDDYDILMGTVGAEVIAQRGMGIKAPRYLRVYRREEEFHSETLFLYNDEGTRKFLLANFPNLGKDARQREQARVWVTVIYAYFRKGWGDARIEFSYGWKKGTAGSIVQQIRRKIKGLRRNGKPYSTRKRGRPRRPRELKKAA